MLQKRFWLLCLFFLSGIPALIYQLIWQRALFSFYGVNIQSVTVVVADFMLGLGIGALSGGYLSRLNNLNLLLIFALLEVSIGVFGYFSLPILDWMAHKTILLPFNQTAALVFVFLLFPTALMGASLPILSEYLVRRYPHIAKNIALLYATNTLGSAFACFLCANFMFSAYGLNNSIFFAVCLNLSIGCGALLLMYQPYPEKNELHLHTENHYLLLILSMMLGFISLSYEIIWLRVISFSNNGSAPAIINGLGYYLVGLSYGAFYCYLFCKYFKLKPTSLFNFFLYGGFISATILPLMIFLSHYNQSQAAIATIAIGTLPFGILMPLLVHYSASQSRGIGKNMGHLYFANIIGGTSGCLITGFLLLDWFSIQSISVMLFTVSLISSYLVYSLCNVRKIKYSYQISISLSTVLLIILTMFLENFHAKVLFKADYLKHLPLKAQKSNNVGDIIVTKNNTVIGGGVYDGVFNIKPEPDLNGIYRAYFIPSFAENAQKVLIIGLSSGSWAQIVAHLPKLKQLTIIEINPAYIEIIKQYPEIKSLLSDPKVNIVIDDGRRYLQKHPLEQYDLIMMNTTFHWRAYVSFLVSKEMLATFKNHLTPKGILYYNTTFSKRIIVTALKTFPFVFQVGNFIACAKQKFIFNPEQFKNTLLNYTINGEKIFKPNMKMLKTLVNTTRKLTNNKLDLHTYRLLTQQQLIKETQHTKVITDDNMGHEWQ